MMTLLVKIPLYDAVGGYVVTIVSIVFTLIVIAALVLVAKRARKRRNMVKNKPMKNDFPNKGKK